MSEESELEVYHTINSQDPDRDPLVVKERKDKIHSGQNSELKSAEYGDENMTGG